MLSLIYLLVGKSKSRGFFCCCCFFFFCFFFFCFFLNELCLRKSGSVLQTKLSCKWKNVPSDMCAHLRLISACTSRHTAWRNCVLGNQNELSEDSVECPSWSGPSCSKLTTSLVNDSLKFKWSDTQIYWNFLLKKLLTFFQQKISEYCVLNPLKQLTKWPLTSLLI